MTAIAITDQSWGIAKHGKQVFTIPEDLAFFRAKTIGNVVVMGRKTLAALPGGQPLAGRVNVVLTRSGGDNLPAGCVAATMETLPGLVAGYEAGGKMVYVAGGGEVYRLLLPYCHEALVTRVLADGMADVFFPNLDEKMGWKILEKSAINTGEKLRWQFFRYGNAAPLEFG